MARTPQSQWKEQLMRMKSGGLDMVAVYFFWIHHEEIENGIRVRRKKKRRSS